MEIAFKKMYQTKDVRLLFSRQLDFSKQCDLLNQNLLYETDLLYYYE